MKEKEGDKETDKFLQDWANELASYTPEQRNNLFKSLEEMIPQLKEIETLQKETTIDNLFANSLAMSKYTRTGEIQYGINNKYSACRIKNNRDEILWMKIQTRNCEHKFNKLWFGEIDAENLKGVKKPKLKGTITRIVENFIARTDTYEYISFPICSTTPMLKTNLSFNDKWWTDLFVSLENLKKNHTQRICLRQDVISQEIKNRYDDYSNYSISNWSTIHGDLHWANLTKEECWIFDWEGWGKGPVGLDEAFLYCHTLLQPIIAEKIYQLFFDLLDCKDGFICQLYVCSKLLEAIELQNEHHELREPLKTLANKLLGKLS